MHACYPAVSLSPSRSKQYCCCCNMLPTVACTDKILSRTEIPKCLYLHAHKETLPHTPTRKQRRVSKNAAHQHDCGPTKPLRYRKKQKKGTRTPCKQAEPPSPVPRENQSTKAAHGNRDTKSSQRFIYPTTSRSSTILAGNSPSSLLRVLRRANQAGEQGEPPPTPRPPPLVHVQQQKKTFLAL